MPHGQNDSNRPFDATPDAPDRLADAAASGPQTGAGTLDGGVIPTLAYARSYQTWGGLVSSTPENRIDLALHEDEVAGVGGVEGLPRPLGCVGHPRVLPADDPRAR